MTAGIQMDGSASGEGGGMRTVWIFLIVAVFGAGCGSLGNLRGTEEFVVEVTGYRMWKEVYYFDGRVDSQWMILCKMLSPKARLSKEMDIIVTERDNLFQCPTGTVLKCNIDSQAVSAWERVARNEAASLDPEALRSSTEELERKVKALERTQSRSTIDSTAVTEARQAANDARNRLLQAHLYLKAIVVKAADVARIEVMKEGSGN